jgi:hypothetical protein
MADDGERRQGVLETAHALGELSALIRSTIITAKDQQTQLHEMKHDIRNQMTVMTAFDERLKSHINADEKNFSDLLNAIKENRARSEENLTVFRQMTSNELIEYRKGLASDLMKHQEFSAGEFRSLRALGTQNQKQLEALMLWRNKILGGVAMLSVLLALFGRVALNWIISHFD